jgi:uncharacterized tellurite resistance protein B-like protein
MDAALSKKICRLVAGIVVADNDLDDAEDKFLDRMLVRFGIPASERDMLFPIVDKDEAAVEMRSLPVDLQHETVTLLIEAAAADGKIATEERAYMQAVAEVIGLAPAEMDQKLDSAVKKQLRK